MLNKVSSSEIKGRIEYLQEVFGVYFYKNKSEKYTELISYPNNLLNLLYIVGHNDKVSKYLDSENIVEDIIIIVSCTFTIPNKLKKANKTIYLSKMDDFGNTLIRDGKSYGFEFNITDSELQLYNNSNLNIKDRINKSFRKEAYNGKYI